MSDLTHIWRPKPVLRAIAIGLIWRNDTILASAVTQDDGRVKGWRPLGGGIEFGESAETALRREFKEEIGASLESLSKIGCLDNIYEHEGKPGHELVVVFSGELSDPGQARAERFILEDSGARNQAGWIAASLFLSGGETLLPIGLEQMLHPLASARGRA